MENQQDLKPQISPLTFSTVVIEKYMCFFVFFINNWDGTDGEGCV